MIFLKGMPIAAKAIAGEGSVSIMAIGRAGARHPVIVVKFFRIQIVYTAGAKRNSYYRLFKFAINLRFRSKSKEEQPQ
jgi:hypothetical protein